MRVALAAPSAFEDRIPDLLPEGADLPYSSLTIDGMNDARAAIILPFACTKRATPVNCRFRTTISTKWSASRVVFRRACTLRLPPILNQQHDPAAMDFHVDDELFTGDTVAVFCNLARASSAWGCWRPR